MAQLDVAHDTRMAITDVLHRYCTGIDTKNWDLFASCFWPDATADYRGRDYADAASIVRYMADIHRDLDGSAHRLTNLVIELDGEVAHVHSYVDAVLVHADHPDGPTFRVIGAYHDTFHHRHEWRISNRRFVHLLTEGNRSMLASERPTTTE